MVVHTYMDILDNIKEIVHNNKKVKQITDSSGKVIWADKSILHRPEPPQPEH